MKAIILIVSLFACMQSCFCQKAFINAEIFTGAEELQDYMLIVDNGTITEITKKSSNVNNIDEVIDLKGKKIIPGFVDLQVNGGGGVLLNNQPSIDGIKTIFKAHSTFGTVAMLPTLISDDLNVTQQVIKAIDSAILAKEPGIMGVHLEGPFLSKSKKGIHNDSYFKKLNYEHIPLLTSLKNGKTLITLAPENTEPEIIKILTNKGVKVFAGHTNATYDKIQIALKNGLCGFTHLYNAMSPLTSREPNVVGAALEDQSSYCGIINDGYHVHPVALKIAIKAKHPTKTFLVTDSVATVGSTSKKFYLQDKAIMEQDGRCVDDSGVLGGSTLTMIQAVKNTIALGFDWQEAVRMASLYPAECLGVSDKYGKLQKGAVASFIVIDENFNIKSVWIEGNMHFTNRSDWAD